MKTKKVREQSGQTYLEDYGRRSQQENNRYVSCRSFHCIFHSQIVPKVPVIHHLFDVV